MLASVLVSLGGSNNLCHLLQDVTYSQCEYPESVPGARMQQLYEDSDNLVW
jgi:hypothetical protein